MLTKDDVKEISRRMASEKTDGAEDCSWEDISAVVCRVDVFPLDDDGGESVLHRHIDIEYSFGDYYEAEEEDPLFRFIAGLSGLVLPEEETEIILYEE